MDCLSEEEAGIMSGRLMRKVRSLVTLDDEKAKALEDQVTDIINCGLIGETPDESSPRERSSSYFNKNWARKA